MNNSIVEKFISINDTQIFLRHSLGQNRELPSLFCIHGNFGSSRWFSPIMNLYKGPLIALDMPNFGFSDHILHWSIADYAEWIIRVLKVLNISSVALMGHSLGGAVAMEVVSQRPDLVHRLYLVNSSPVEGLRTPHRHYSILASYRTNKRLLTHSLQRVVPALTDETLFSHLVEDAWRMNKDCLIGHAEALEVADFRKKLTGLKIPVHILYGTQDLLVRLEQAQSMAKFFSTSLHTFNDCGHAPMVEIPHDFVKTLEAFD